MSILICPITYEPLQEKQKYSLVGLRKLSPQLQMLKDLPLTAEQQRDEAIQRAYKMSIQGVQPKISAKLNIQQSQFEVTDIGGNYILKPQHQIYSELPENEDLTMHLAAAIGIEVPLHGLLYCIDGSLTYFIKRFDRVGRNKKIAVEDFSQLSGKTRDTKYESSMERLIPVIEQYCTFPLLEKKKLLQRTLFNYLIGNEDMHLKNFSLITRDNKIELAPAYDFLNTTIVGQFHEEIALPLNGKKNNLRFSDLFDYYGIERLGLNKIVVEELLQNFSKNISDWKKLISVSFLSGKMKEKYLELLDQRSAVLKL